MKEYNNVSKFHPDPKEFISDKMSNPGSKYKIDDYF